MFGLGVYIHQSLQVSRDYDLEFPFSITFRSHSLPLKWLILQLGFLIVLINVLLLLTCSSPQIQIFVEYLNQVP